MSNQLKEFRGNYHKWKQNPVQYKYPGERHRCDCCGEQHEGNFCPLCGQKATQGPVTWKSVWEGVMELWGLQSRSLPYTAWQLLFRPGHLMRDYITGKRQVSFPPVKMLVVMGLIVYLLGHWFFPDDYSHEMKEVTSTGIFYYANYAINWIMAHDEWGTLFMFSALILPTWFVFRHAPLLERHSLPQGFFIQVFIANQSMILELIVLLPALMVPSVPLFNFRLFMLAMLTIYLLIDYKQLFGYNWWGTLWRIVIMLVFVICAVIIVGALPAVTYFIGKHKFIAVFGVLTFVVVSSMIVYLLFYCVDVINRKLWLERGKWAVAKGLAISLSIMLVLLVSILIIRSVIAS